MNSGEIKKFILRRLLQKGEDTVSTVEIKMAVRSAFNAVFTDGDLDEAIVEMKDANLVVCVQDPVTSGLLWALTDFGKIRAQQLVKLT